MSARGAALAAGLVGLLACGEAGVEVQEAEAATPARTRSEPGTVEGDVVRIESPDGSVLELLESGAGSEAAWGDRVTLHLHGTVEGSDEVVTSTRAEGIPRTFVLGRDRLIPGLEQRLVGMTAGTRAVLHVPAAEAYGETGTSRVPAAADLVFEVHLLAVEPAR